jgi:transposase
MARRTFTKDFKTSAAKLVTEQGYTITKAAQSLGVNQASVRHWMRLYTTATNGSADPPTDPVLLAAENRRLREENRRLLMEREILKKATAFFAKELP